MRSRIDLTNVNAVANWLRASSAPQISAVEQLQIQNCTTAASAWWIRECGFGSETDAPTASPLCETVQYTEAYDGKGKTRLWLRNRPVRSVQSLQINDTVVPLSTAWNVAGYVIDRAGHSVQLRAMGNWPLSTRWSGIQFEEGVANVLITYTAGYPPVAVVNELQTVPSSPGPYVLNTLRPAFLDVRIRYNSTLALLTPVAGAPAAGQYQTTDIGQYVFAVADAGAQVLVDYNAPGTPSDIVLAATQMVAVNYKRRDWIDQKSQASMGGSTQFQDWELPPEVTRVLNYYSRSIPI